MLHFKAFQRKCVNWQICENQCRFRESLFTPSKPCKLQFKLKLFCIYKFNGSLTQLLTIILNQAISARYDYWCLQGEGLLFIIFWGTVHVNTQYFIYLFSSKFIHLYNFGSCKGEAPVAQKVFLFVCFF